MAEWSKAVDLSPPPFAGLESLLQKCAWVRTPLVSFCSSFCTGEVFWGLGVRRGEVRCGGVFGGEGVTRGRHAEAGG